jgi:uridine kinase
MHEGLKGNEVVYGADLTTVDGQRTYQRSVLLLLIAAVQRLLPGATVTVEHSLSNGVYCEIHGRRPLTPQDTALLEQNMREMVATNMPIKVDQLPKDRALQLLEKTNPSAVQLLSGLPAKSVPVTSCGDYHDYYHYPVLAHAGLTPLFRLHFYLPGLILQIPEDNSGTIPPYREQPKLFSIYREAEKWARISGVDNAANLNETIQRGEAGDLIRVSEALHEKKIAAIADMVVNNPEIRLITIAGPSSSGKTTFAQRLKIQLRVNGLRPVTISLDDYFFERDKTPLDESGKPDYESITALDLDLLGDHLSRLIQSEAVDIPSFDFHTGKRRLAARRLQIAADQPIIIEGIHGLNERLTASIPKGNKFKIYVSALTQVNLHDHIRIHTTDARLIRRMVRDAQFRSHPAAATIRIWPMVRRGERNNIFPFQEEADVMFNSALVYEPAVLKEKAEPLLRSIPAGSPERQIADNLLWLLSHFHSLSADEIPNNSILREFIGGSCFV